MLYVEAKQRGPGKYECLTDNARQTSGRDLFEWVKQAVDLGAGEILLTSVDREGTGKGYDLELVANVAELVPVPVIASGGAGKAEDVQAVITQGHADAVCAASLFHYAVFEEFKQEAVQFEEGNTEFLKGRLPLTEFTRRNLQPIKIPELKARLHHVGLEVRLPRAGDDLPSALAVSGAHEPS